MTDWSLVYNDIDDSDEAARETLCALGNGYVATRGAWEECEVDGTHYPGSYLAGCYNRLTTEIAGRNVENEDLVNLPNWLPLRFRIDGGPWVSPGTVEILDVRQELDMQQALLLRRLRFRDAAGRTTVYSSRRLVHIRQPHLVAIEATIQAEDWSGSVEVLSALDGRVRNTGVARYADLSNRHLELIAADVVNAETVQLEMQTTRSLIRLALAARTRIVLDAGSVGSRPVEAPRTTYSNGGLFGQVVAFDLAEGQTARVEKVVALFSSRDHAISAPDQAARTAVARAGTFEDLLDEHAGFWSLLWRLFGMEISRSDGSTDLPVAMVLRLHIFHLIQTASPNNLQLDAGVPARGLHGEAYRGHIFWDELFIFPTLNYRLPEVTRSLLLYRYRRLGEARAAAQAAGFAGAMFPWQSGSDGRDETQPLHLNPASGRWLPDFSHLQRHVSAAIAYNIWQYYQVTQDVEFMLFYGAEMFLEIARFWASVATYNEALNRYEIRGVMGPDEYHDSYPDRATPGIDNNAYTNAMAAWVLWRAFDVLEALSPERRDGIRRLLKIEDAELQRWAACSRRMRIDFHDGQIISQFEGYDGLKEFYWAGYRQKYGNIQRLDRILEAEGDTPNRYKLSKQADVLMLFYLFSAEELTALFERLGYPFDPETIPHNIDYYERRTSHGSTLSRVVSAWVLSRSDRRRSWRTFIEALESDYGDVQQGTTGEGIHLGAMAGTADLMLRCYTGLESRAGVLWLNPNLPLELERLQLTVRYRNHTVALDIMADRLWIKVTDSDTAGIRIGVRDRLLDVTVGKTLEIDLVPVTTTTPAPN